MCIQVPNGELNSEQMRFLGESVRKYGEKGCLDITTRANIQLRGIPLEDAGPVFAGLQEVGLSSVQTGKPLRKMASKMASWFLYILHVITNQAKLCSAALVASNPG